MPFVVDESSYRIDKTAYPTRDEAVNVGLESARILGRRVNVYQLEDGVETFIGHAMPDGTFDEKAVNELAEPNRNQDIPPVAPVAIGATDQWSIVVPINDNDRAKIDKILGKTILATERDAGGPSGECYGNAEFDVASEQEARSLKAKLEKFLGKNQVDIKKDGKYVQSSVEPYSIIATLDDVSEALEVRGEFELALAVDEAAEKLAKEQPTAEELIEKIEDQPPVMSPSEDMAEKLTSSQDFRLSSRDKDKIRQAVRLGRG